MNEEIAPEERAMGVFTSLMFLTIYGIGLGEPDRGRWRSCSLMAKC